MPLGITILKMIHPSMIAMAPPIGRVSQKEIPPLSINMAVV